MIEIRHLTKAFGGTRAVSDCSISLEGLTISGLIGPNVLLAYQPANLKLTATAMFGLFPEDPLVRLFVIAGWQF